MKLAILTEQRYLVANPYDWYISQIIYEESLLACALTNCIPDLDIIRVSWSDLQINWSSFDGAIFRTTWDYFDRPEEFSHWLNNVDSQCRLIHDRMTVLWNMDKRYLFDLAERGIDIVPTILVNKPQDLDLAKIAYKWNCQEFVIKPTVSGGALDTHRLSVDDVRNKLEELCPQKTMLIQPFQSRILSEGEWSVMILNQHFTHAVRKRPQQGDYRVQDDFGGTVHIDPPPADLKTFAEDVVRKCPHRLTYARVDVVQTDRGWALMELEAIEPELFMRFHPASATELARGIKKALTRTN